MGYKAKPRKTGYFRSSFKMPSSMEVASVLQHVAYLIHHPKQERKRAYKKNCVPDEPRKKMYRYFDGRTPAIIHCGGIALQILQEPKLEPNVRILGFYVLAYHDVFEDTSFTVDVLHAHFKKHYDCARYLIRYVKAMTFCNFGSERRNLWKRCSKKSLPLLSLFKCYDKYSNLRDATWLYGNAMQLELHLDHARKLAEDVKMHFGELNVVAEIESLLAKIVIETSMSPVRNKLNQP